MQGKNGKGDMMETENLEVTVQESIGQERSLDESERRASAARVKYASLSLSEEGQEILGEQFTDQEIDSLAGQLEEFDQDKAYEAARTLIGKLRQNMQRQQDSCMPEHPEMFYTGLEKFVVGLLKKVSTSAAKGYTGMLNERAAEQNKDDLVAVVPGRREAYQRELERVTNAYCDVRARMTEETITLFNTDDELTRFETSRAEALERLEGVRGEYAAAQQVGNRDEMQRLTERETKLVRDISVYEASIDRLATKVDEHDERITDYLEDARILEAQKKLVGFLMHEFYGAQRTVRRKAASEPVDGIPEREMEDDLTILERVQYMSRQGQEAGEDLTKLLDELPQYAPSPNVRGGGHEGLEAFRTSQQDSLAKVCNRAHRTTQKYRQAYRPTPV